MEFLTSLKNRISNAWIINQARFAGIHRALLDCLENSVSYGEGKDYKPHKMILQQNRKTRFERSMTVITNRNYVVVFPTNRPAETLIIMKQFSGKYMLIRGDIYNNTGKKMHVSIHFLPSLLTDFVEAQYTSSADDRRDITLSCIN